ncbi:MAG TPA: sensor histidine kinase [Clostridiales bacterium]|nr:sensor histidine kinase [Clostridiales bacterium]
MKQEMQILEHMLYLQKQQFKTSKDTIDIINIKCHDLKHQISQLEGRLSESELNELKDAISIYDLSVKTGNDVLDVILAEKSLKCWQNAIKLNCMVDGAILSFMRSSDIYSLFGNAIDNAIDAVQKLEDPDKRVISLSVKRAMGMVAIHIENYYKGALSFENDLPKTTKKDVRYHGFGLKSIKMIAQKYNGFMSFDASNYIFKLNILLPFRQEKSDR